MDNYESKYNDLINRLRKAKEDDSVNSDRYCCVIDDIVPKLKESENERIRKEIISVLKWANYKGIYDKHIAWLEKQAEQKPVFEMKTPEESLGIDSDTYNKIVDECIYGEQNTWKPSGEQMDELRKYSDNVVLRNLYYNLKKLKVE